MKRLLSSVVLTVLLLPSFAVSAGADLISTESALAAEQRAASLQTVNGFLMRNDVRLEMIRLGVDPDSATRRVDTLTLAELQQLAGRINELPAGGIVEVIGIVAVVLLVLELLGVTDVFTNF